MPVVFDGELFADYHQIYLADAKQPPGLPDEWTDDKLRQRVNLVDRALVISTVRDTDVQVKIELHATRPLLDIANVDHAIEVSLRVPSGKLIVAGLTDYEEAATRVGVPAGDLRAPIVFSGLGTLSEDGLAGDDQYVVHLWPGRPEGPAVHKQWRGAH
jgi:hypothetical protein